MKTTNSSSSSSAGIGFVGLLTITFIVLKLCHIIEWSWWWVLSPIWICIASVVLILIIIGIYIFWPFGRDDKKKKGQK